MKITDVRVHPGDSGFLVDNGKTSILCDTGFAFTGTALAEKVKALLGGRSLDYIVLTHSHYDHSLGVPYVKKMYPNAVVVAGEYDREAFKKPHAIAAMRDLDRRFAHTCGVESYEDLIDELSVDMVVSDGDFFRLGDMDVQAINLPGHTKSCLGFLLEKEKILLSSETIGIFDGKETVMPIFLISYKQSRNSILKVQSLDLDGLLIPHYGLIDRETTRRYLDCALFFIDKTTIEIKERLENGVDKSEILQFIKERFYDGVFEKYYPIDAFRLNTSIMINVIEKELVAG